MVLWGVVGVGLAGRARTRAIVEDPRCELVGLARGRFAGEFEAPQVNFEELVHRVDALAICSPNGLHAEQTAYALEHGCHVLVEFPLALEARQARGLFERAQANNRLLHVEHIELLLAWHQALKVQVRGDLDVKVSMTKKGLGTERPEQFFGACVARLHNIADLSPIVALNSVVAHPGRLVIELELESGQARLELQAGTSLKRSTAVDVRNRDHHWCVRQHRLFRDDQELPLPVSTASLFALDHEQMMQRLDSKASSYVSPSRVVDILQYSQRIASTKLSDTWEVP